MCQLHTETLGNVSCSAAQGTDVQSVTHTVLDTDNFEEVLEFPARAYTDICVDALEFSARYHADFPHDAARKNLDRNSTRIRAENRKSHLCREVACEAEPVLLRLQRYT